MQNNETCGQGARVAAAPNHDEHRDCSWLDTDHVPDSNLRCWDNAAAGE